MEMQLLVMEYDNENLREELSAAKEKIEEQQKEIDALKNSGETQLVAASSRNPEQTSDPEVQGPFNIETL